MVGKMIKDLIKMLTDINKRHPKAMVIFGEFKKEINDIDKAADFMPLKDTFAVEGNYACVNNVIILNIVPFFKKMLDQIKNDPSFEKEFIKQFGEQPFLDEDTLSRLIESKK